MKPKEFDIGVSDYRRMVLTDKYVVDKSMFIKEFLQSQKQIMLIPRPRRFGKTFNVSMLRAFFDCTTDDNVKLFEGTEIAQETEIMNTYCGKYPVISLTFKDIKADNWEDMYEELTVLFQALFARFNFLLDSDKVNETDKATFKKILSLSGLKSQYKKSLETLIRMTYDYYGKELIVLIDEYDSPIHSSYLNDDESGSFYKSVVGFMRDLFSGAFKDNFFVFKACITGILRVSKESIFSGLNNVAVYSILDDRFADKFGLTDSEVVVLSKYFNLEDKLDEIRNWYNGYRIGQQTGIYNPWSLLNYFSDPKLGFKSYWLNSSSNLLPQSLISLANADEIRDSIAVMLQGGTIKTKIDEDFVFTDLRKKTSFFWTLMLLSGYLTLAGKDDEEFLLRIPNNEVRKVFTRIFDNWLQMYLNVGDNNLEIIANSLISRNIPLFERKLNETMLTTLSYFDLEAANEKIYQVYMIALLSVLQKKYFVKSNRESGDGRYDILLLPKNKGLLGVVLELKAITPQKQNESDEEFAARIKQNQVAALKQVDDKRYLTELRENGILDSNILTCAVIFSGKKAYVLTPNEQNT